MRQTARLSGTPCSVGYQWNPSGLKYMLMDYAMAFDDILRRIRTSDTLKESSQMRHETRCIGNCEKTGDEVRASRSFSDGKRRG